MDDEDIAWGKPSLEEYKEYFATPCLSIDEREVMEGESSAGSIDLSDSFKTLLENRRRELDDIQPSTPVTSKKVVHLLDKTWTPFVGRLQDSVVEKSDWEPSDETFARMEEMCEDTQEAAALERLLDDVAEEPARAVIAKLPVDMTQIHDIEAPSLMWDQTIMHANSPKASPIKMVGMMRPSTIVEESTVNSTNDTAETIQERENESTESVISVDSTGESFVTANPGNGSLESVTSAENIPINKRKFFRDSMFPVHLVKKEENSENFLDSLDVVEISDTSSVDESNDENSRPEFNNTFELMDFIVAQAEKVQKDTVTASPMKSVNKVATTTPTFKKPTRAPLPKSTGKPKFNYIVSPIQQYIHNTAQNPVIQRHHSLRDPRLIDEIDERKLRQTQFFAKPDNKAELPQLATVAASSRQMYDARTPQKVPGGDKIKGLIGKTGTPTVVKHEGRLKMHEKGAKLNAVNNTIDNSFADLSLMSGDVSVRVVKDVKRL